MSSAGSPLPGHRRKSAGAVLLRLAAVAAVAAVPPGIVVLHYWIGYERLAIWCNNYWLQFRLSSHLDWPSFLPFVVAGLLAMPPLMLLGRRDPPPWGPGPRRRASTRRRNGRAGNCLLLASGAAAAVLLAISARTGKAPGSAYAVALAGAAAGALAREIRPRTLLRLWRRKAPGWISLAVLQVSLLAAFAADSAWPERGALLFAAPLLFSVAALRSRRARIPVWGWISLLAIAVRAFRLDSWMYTLIGDEYGFRVTARDLANGPIGATAAEAGRRLFEVMPGGGIFLDRLLQAIGMLAGGTGNFGWKLSTLWLPALAIPFYYGFVRTFAGRRIAVFACFLLACSEYLMSFTKIGYPTLHAHFAEALVLAAAAWAVRSRRTFAWVCLGMAAAACLYVFPAVLFVLPAVAILVAIYDLPGSRHSLDEPPRSRGVLTRWGAAAAAFFAAAAPMLMQAEFYRSKVRGTFYADPTPGRAGRVAANVLYAALAHLRRPIQSHYVWIGFLDPVTGALLAIGAALVLVRARRDRFARVCLLAGTVMLLLASTGAEPPSATRMWVLLPGYALLAAVGLAWILDRACDAGLPARGAAALSVLLLAAALASNLAQAYAVTPRMQDRYQGFQAQFNRVGRRMRAPSPDPPKQIVMLVPNRESHDYDIGVIAEAHRLPHVLTVELVRGRVPPDYDLAVRDRDTVVMLRPDVPPADVPGIEADLRERGKVPCEARDASGQVRLLAWQSPGRPRYCE